MQHNHVCCNRGYTTMELVVVIIVIGILAAAAIPVTNTFVTNAKIGDTQKRMNALTKAIMGDPSAGFLGYRDNLGVMPPGNSFDRLLTVGTDSPYNPYTRTGWNGPYVESQDRNGNGRADILEDAWDRPFTFTSASGEIRSDGPDRTPSTGDDIVLNVE